MKKQISRRSFLQKSAVGLGAGVLGLKGIRSFSASSTANQPNILWIVSEDNSASYLGCYGNKDALTPNLDKLAEQGITYDNAFANAPVCAPMRNSIITGMYASTLGCHNMRSEYPIPDKFKFFPLYLRQAGYYCTNNAKEDYNTLKPENVWDESSSTGHYRNRKKTQPFFAVFNTELSHEQKIHFDALLPKDKLKHDPDTLELAPYHPDLPEIRHCYANYYEYINKMDAKVGELLKELEENGLAEDTIVFYYSDHGGVLPRSKRFLYESGTQIPLIIRFPPKYQHLTSKQPGSREDRLVSLVDLAPTILSLLNIPIPAHFSGHAFLGKQKTAEPAYIHFFRQRMDERYDMMRAVRDKEFRYIRNYMPHRIYGQHLWYLWRSPATRTWETAFNQGKCNRVQSRFWGDKDTEELYDVKADPHNVNNLANDPQYHNVLERMRKETSRWVRVSRDAGFLPEGLMLELAGDKTVYEITHSSNFTMEKIIETAEMASSKNIKYLSTLIKRLSHTQAAVRYWAATGCAILARKADKGMSELKKLLNDPVADVRIVTAEALCKMGYKKESLDLLVKEMKSENPRVQLHALNVLSALGDDAKMVVKDIMTLTPWGLKTDDYFHQAYIPLISKLKPGWQDYVIW